VNKRPDSLVGVPTPWAYAVLRTYLSDDFADARPEWDAEDLLLNVVDDEVEGKPGAVLARIVDAVQASDEAVSIPEHCTHPGRAGHSLRSRVRHYRPRFRKEAP